VEIEIDKAEAAFAGATGVLIDLEGLEDCLVTVATTAADYSMPSVVAQGMKWTEQIFGEGIGVVDLNIEVATAIDEDDAETNHAARVSAIVAKVREADFSDQLDEAVEDFFCWSAEYAGGNRLPSDRALIDVLSLRLTCRVVPSA
jgi:hypothetical protein